MGVFGEGRDDWELKFIDERVKHYFEKIGFKIFSTDGKYFLDEYKNKYGPWADLAHTEKIEEVEGGKNYYEVIRGVRDVNLEEDVYQFLYETSSCWIGKMYEWSDFHFLGGKGPSKTDYNAAIITPVGTWREDAIDGGGEKTLYSLLMLESRESRRERFVKNPTPEEIRARETEESMLPF